MEKSSQVTKTSNSKIVDSSFYKAKNTSFGAKRVLGCRCLVQTKTGTIAAFPGEMVLYYKEKPIAVLDSTTFDEIFEQVTFCKHGRDKTEPCFDCAEKSRK